jgi:FG-GAP repeat
MRTAGTGRWRWRAAALAILGTAWGMSAPAALGQFLEPEATALQTFVGHAPDDGFGWAAERIGDLDGDGVEEVIVGANSDGTGGPQAGRAFVFSGRTGALLNTITGGPYDFLGYGVAGVGDVNGDGRPDYAVGSRGLLSSPTAGGSRVDVYSGADHTRLLTLRGAPRSFFGADINAAGDVNGDGRADIIVGAPQAADGGAASGLAAVFSGADGSLIWSYPGPAPGVLLGTGVSGIDDMDGDGVPDEAVGARDAGPTKGGRVFILSGADGRLIRTLVPDATATDFGWFFVHDAGDVNGDGRRDIYVGDFNDKQRGGPGTGKAYVFSGADGTRLLTLLAENRGDGFGVGRGAGDVDGDGCADLIVAAFSSGAAVPNGGKAYVFSGRTGAVIRTITGTVPGDQLGFDALAVGDTNGDGLIDFMVTAAGNSTTGAGLGSAYIVAGLPACFDAPDGSEPADTCL